RKRRLYSLQQYFHRLLKQLLVSRKDLLELAVHSGLDMPQKRPLLTPKSQPDLQEPRVARRVGRILREVKAEVMASSGAPIPLVPHHHPPPPCPAKPLHPGHEDRRHEFCERDLKSMLQNHREKRKRHPDHPDLVTSDIHLGNMLSRVNIGRKVSTMGHWTDYVVRPSTGDERHVFQMQRYDQPHKAFTFRMHGFQSVVGPVKGVFDKGCPGAHPAAVRPARLRHHPLPGAGRGGQAPQRLRAPGRRSVRLLKDSQFLAPDVTSAQVNTVVSGALDRLHYEKDPCVKYDIGRKLWIYLHQRIHQAQAAAAKARKALQQKPKPASKPKSGSKEAGGKVPGSLEAAGLESGPLSPVPTTPSTPGTPKSPLASAVGTPTKTTGLPETLKRSPGSQVGSAAPQPSLSSSSATSSSAHQHAARLVSHLAAGTLPQVRVVSAQPGGLGASVGGAQATLLHPSPHQIRVPVSMGTKGLSQTVVSLPLRSQVGGGPAPVPTTLSVSALAVAKPRPGSPASPAKVLASPALLQSVSGQGIKQVSITGQLGVKGAGPGTGIPITATNLRIQGKDVLRLPSSSITTDSKGQTVLRITPDMMATLAKSPVATVKLSSDFLGSTGGAHHHHGVLGGKSISATLHAGSAGDTAIRLMPTLAVTMADQKTRTFTTHVSSAAALGDAPKAGGATIRIMPGLGVIPHKQGQTITMTTVAGSKPLTAVTMAAAVTKGITVSASPLAISTATATVRQVPISATGKLPTRITVPLSVLNQPLKTKSVVASPLVKGSLNTNFVTAQQLQQLQQQGQATQVRIQTVQTQQIQQRIATGTPKSVSTVVVTTTAPSPKCPPDLPAPPPAAPQP
ncbi:hypothetical protein CRUP_000832, partial [Coryphaenoides rupestris]